MSAIIATPTAAEILPAAKRGSYDEIMAITMPDGSQIGPHSILKKFSASLPEKFIDFDKKNRGDALNIDLYGYDPVQDVAVVQIRHFFRRYKNGYGNTHKDYVLVGQNEETKEFFRHPVSAHAVRAGIRSDRENPVAAVRAAQRWMWDVSDAQLATGIRQGDILIVPVRSRPAGSVPIEETVVVVAETHEVSGHEFSRDRKGRVYVKGPTMRHTKGQHAVAFGDGDGWHAIRVGQEALTWKWGERLGD